MAEAENLKTYTTKQIAEMFNISQQTLKNWDTQLPPMKKTQGGHRRYTQVHIDALKKILHGDPQPAPQPAESEAEHVPEF